MDASVNELLSLEEQAREILEQAKAGARRLEAQTQAQKQQLLEEESRRAAEAIQAAQAREAEETRRLELALERRGRQLGEEMERQFAGGRQGWEDALFSRCVGGEPL